MRDGILMVRALEAAGGPVVPEGWMVETQSGGWYEATRTVDSALIAAYRANTNAEGNRGLFLVLGERSVIDEIAASSDYASTLRDLWINRADAAVRAVVRRWRDWRIDGWVRDPDGNTVTVSSKAVRLMAAEGFSLPDPAVDPLPWNLDSNGQLTTQAKAVVRVTVIHRPALLATMALPWIDFEDAEATI